MSSRCMHRVCGWVGGCRQENGLPSGNKSRSEPPLGWETKRCQLCSHLTVDPSTMDKHEKRTTRKWGLKNFWGDYCWWCTRTISTRYAHLGNSAFSKWLNESPDHIFEARASAFCYLSLREEGRTQVSIDQLFKRIELCERISTEWSSITGGEQ